MKKLLYQRICFVNGVRKSAELVTINFDDLLSQFVSFSIANITESFNDKIKRLVDRWNSQPESKLTGLKWEYEIVKIF